MQWLWKIPVLGPLVFKCWKIDARRKLSWMNGWLSRTDTLIEIGSGPGSLLDVMRSRGFRVEGLDIRMTAFRPDLKPHLYAGDIMPFETGAYDVALLPTILHHTPDPEAILREASRIAPRLIIIEDVYDNSFMEWLTKRVDNVMNLEFIGHPHSNRTDAGWRSTFKQMGLELTHAHTHRVAGIFKQAVYVLDV